MIEIKPRRYLLIIIVKERVNKFIYISLKKGGKPPITLLFPFIGVSETARRTNKKSKEANRQIRYFVTSLASHLVRIKHGINLPCYLPANLKYLLVTDNSKIWIPDLFILNEKDSQLHKLMTSNTFFRITPSGHVLYSARSVLSISFTNRL